MKVDKALYILRLVLEWILVGLAAVVMVCDIIEPGSANGFLWAAISLMSGVRCIMSVCQNRFLEESRDFWKGLAEKAIDVLWEEHEKNMRRLARSQADENDLK